MVSKQADIGIVVIGRNEGGRLELCLESLIKQTTGPLVYVDSGSTDNSVNFAKKLGVYVEELDISIPFTMARGRNTGFQRLMSKNPDLRYVQFVDGDCEVESSWIATAYEFLQDRQDVSVVCGFRRERFPEKSVYNTLIDLEWQGSVGDISACGGDAMYRTEIFQNSGGFNETMIAGEEPELCLRIRRDGGVVWRLDENMVIHDAALNKFSQWWTRTKRGGYAYAEGVAMHGSSPQRHYVSELARLLFYGVAVPGLWLCAMVLGGLVPNLSLLMVLSTLVMMFIYIKPFIGALRTRLRLGNDFATSCLYAGFCVLAKFPEAQGALRYFANRLSGKKTALIEYKNSST